MEKDTEKRLDAVLEDELARGYRIKDLPESLQAQLQAESGVALKRVRFTRLNPAKRRKIAQTVQRQYHKDLQDPSILSHEQILKLVQERGEWSPEMDKEMAELQQSTSRDMGELFMDGMAQSNWTNELLDAAAEYREKATATIEDEVARAELMAKFDRWLEWSPERQDEWTERFAAAQEREKYSVDADYQVLMGAVSDLTAIDNLNTIDELRDRLQRYVKLQRNRIRLAELQLRHAKIFSESVEQRRDNAEEMARLYFIAEVVDADGKPVGPLAKEFDGLWDFPESAIQWLLVEAYFFLNGIPDEAREYLQTFGFMTADAGDQISSSGESEPSDESPAPPTSRLDSSVSEETVSVSSEPKTPTVLTTDK